MKKLLRKIILWALEEKNTTAENSDVSNLQVGINGKRCDGHFLFGGELQSD